MSALIKFAKDLLPLLLFYPLWAQVLFVATAVAFTASTLVFVWHYRTAETSLNRRQVASEVSMNVGVLSEPAPLETPQDTSTTTKEHYYSPDGKVDLSVQFHRTVAEEDITYTQNDSVGLCIIRPAVSYLTLLDAGGPIQPLYFDHTPFSPSLPSLDVKVVNNSTKTIFFTSAIFDVERSSIDTTPIPIIVGDGYGWSAQQLYIQNEGWGDVRNCRLTFNLLPSNAALTYSPPFSFELNLGAIGRDTLVDLHGAFEAAGIDNELIKSFENADYETRSNVEYQHRLAGALGPFKDNVAIACGVMTYGKDNDHDRAVRFNAPIHVFNENSTGAPAPPTANYNLMLRAQGKNYKESLSISQALKPGDVDRFTFALAAPKSSAHRFTLRLIYNDRETYSTIPIDLHVFIPRSNVHLATKSTFASSR